MTDPISYSLGPFSAGSDSFLGGLLGFAHDVSTNYATGLNAVVNAPAASATVLYGGHVTPDTVSQLQAAEAKGLPSSPFVQIPTIFGTWLGTGVNVLGAGVGITGVTATPGLATGAAAATTGVTSAVTGTVAGGAAGIIPGAASGIGAALSHAGAGVDLALGKLPSGVSAVASGQAQTGTYLLIAGGLIVLLLFLIA